MIRPLVLAALTFAALPAVAQSLWTDVAEATLRAAPGARITTPTAYRTVRLDVPQMATRLEAAPLRSGASDASAGADLEIPLPDGSRAAVRVVEASVMAPELQARFPQIRTYLAQGEGSVSGRLSLTPDGFRGMLMTPQGAVYIDPYARGDAENYVVYYSRDLQVDPALRGRIADEVIGESEAPPRGTEARPHGSTLRTYRLAMAATGEYTSYHGGTVAGALAAIVNTVNRVAGVYERDIAVSFQLIPNNDQIIYTNAATDPYTNTSNDLAANITNINTVIGSTNYDVGHLVGTGGGGVAGLGVICTSSKARGLTGSPAPVGDAFDIDYVAHEIGHQFGGNHTMSGCGSVPANARVEPGSGSTIQAYAGICGSQNIQNNSDAFFHGFSLDELTAHVTTGSGGTCGVATATNNPIPTVTAPASVTIPAGTPFVLTGSATDDTPGALTYIWEGMTPGPSGVPNNGSQAPFFRSFVPTASPTRYFPQQTRLIAGQAPVIGERLPTASQTLSFRLTARDNRAGAGAINDATTTVAVDASAGPFVVTFASATGESYAGTATVTWNVANTNTGAVGAANVDILYSTDNGATFPFTLIANTPNTGSRVVGFPATTAQGRILVRASDNVFYNVNARAFAVTATGTTPPNAPPPSIAVTPGALAATLDANTTDTRDLTVQNGAAAGAQDLIVTASVEDLSQPGDVVSPATQAARAARDARRAALAADPSLAAPIATLSKGGLDPASGTGTASRTGGPDAFGYTFKDSSEPGGPTFAWVNIAATGTAVTLGDDTASPAIALPFAFPFYGADRTQLYISSNGFLTFATAGTTLEPSYSNQTLPSVAVPNNLIAMYWDDLNPTVGGGTIRHQNMGDGRFIVQFTGIPTYDAPTLANTFQAILYADGEIDLQYLTVNDVANSHSIGIENADGTDGLTVVANAPYVSNNLAIRFRTPGPQWATVAPESLTITPGTSGVFTTAFDSAELPAGTYTGNVVLTSNDPSRPTASVPLTLTVTGIVSSEGGAVAEFALDAPRPNPAQGASEISFSLAEASQTRLSVVDLLGREVAILVDSEQAAGRHSETLDVRGLAPGVYVVRLAAGAEARTQRLIVVR